MNPVVKARLELKKITDPVKWEEAVKIAKTKPIWPSMGWENMFRQMNNHIKRALKEIEERDKLIIIN